MCRSYWSGFATSTRQCVAQLSSIYQLLMSLSCEWGSGYWLWRCVCIPLYVGTRKFFNIPHDVPLLFVTYTLCVVIIGGFNGAQSARASRRRRNPHPWLAEHIPREYCWSAQSNTIGQREWCQGLAVCGWETTGVAFQVRYSTCLLFGYKYLNCLVHQI